MLCCKKDVDESPPEITVINPVKNQEFNTFDTVFFTAEIKDDKGLKFVSAEILDAGLNPVSLVEARNISGNFYTFRGGIPINNIHLLSGLHYFLITAKDEVNDARSYTEIKINGLPLFTRSYLIYETVGEQVELHGYYNGNDSLLWTIPGPFKDGLIDNYYQQAGFLKGENGKFQTHPLYPFIGPWELEPQFGEMMYCRSQTDIPGIQIGYKNGKMMIYLGEGALKKSYLSETGYFPALSVVNENNVVIWQVHTSGQQNKLEVFFPAGGLKQVSAYNHTIVGLVNKSNDEVYIAANDGNKGLLTSYNLENGFLIDIREFQDEPLSAACRGESEVVFVSSQQGIYRYRGQELQFSKISDIPATHITWDLVNKHLLATTNNLLFVMDIAGNILETYNLSGQAEKAMVWYSK